MEGKWRRGNVLGEPERGRGRAAPRTLSWRAVRAARQPSMVIFALALEPGTEEHTSPPLRGWAGPVRGLTEHLWWFRNNLVVDSCETGCTSSLARLLPKW